MQIMQALIERIDRILQSVIHLHVEVTLNFRSTSSPNLLDIMQLIEKFLQIF